MAAMTNSDPISFYFDFISHNAFIAWTQIHALAARHGPASSRSRSCLQHSSRRTVSSARPRFRRRTPGWCATLRKSARLGLKLAPPASHPSVRCCRCAPCPQPMDAQVRRRLIDHLFAAAWVRVARDRSG
jgi:2-hydroxychromene-2-carboxylate isomerase